jgi:hypothetical protein
VEQTKVLNGTLNNVNSGLNTSSYSTLEIFGGQSFNLYLNIIHFFSTNVNGRESTVNRMLDGSIYLSAFILENYFVRCLETQQIIPEIGNAIQWVIQPK